MPSNSVIGFKGTGYDIGHSETSAFSTAKLSLVVTAFAVSFMFLSGLAFAVPQEFTINVTVANDTAVLEANDTNQGLEGALYVSRELSTNNDWKRSYIRFDLNSFFASESPLSISNVNLTMTEYHVQAASAELEMKIFNVTDTEASNSWKEYSLTTWSNQPCGSARTSLNASCNPTEIAVAPLGHPPYPLSELPKEEYWNVTDAVTHLVGSPASDKSITLLLASPSNLIANRFAIFNSKENVTQIPTLTITYTKDVPPPPPEPPSTFEILFPAILGLIGVLLGFASFSEIQKGNINSKSILGILFSIIMIILMIGIGLSFI